MPGFTPFLPFSLNLFRFVKEIFSPYSHRPNLTPNLHDPFDFLLLRFEELRGKRSHWDDIAEIRQTLRNSLRLKFIPLRLRASTRKKYEVKVEVGWGRSFSKVWWDKKDLENCVVVQRLLCSNFEGGRRGKRGEQEEREKRESNRRDWFGWLLELRRSFRFLNRCPVHWRFSGCSLELEAGTKPAQTQWWLLPRSRGVSMGPYYRHCRNKFQKHIRSSFIRVSARNAPPPPPVESGKNEKDETSVPRKYVISVCRRNNWIVHRPIPAWTRG